MVSRASLSPAGRRCHSGASRPPSRRPFFRLHPTRPRGGPTARYREGQATPRCRKPWAWHASSRHSCGVSVSHLRCRILILGARRRYPRFRGSIITTNRTTRHGRSPSRKLWPSGLNAATTRILSADTRPLTVRLALSARRGLAPRRPQLLDAGRRPTDRAASLL
jgi:hypothetical protein